MASRRSRLKAVANLPIRRKPVQSVQQDVENSKLQDDRKTLDVETDGNEVENKIEETVTNGKPDDSDNTPAAVPSCVSGVGEIVNEESDKCSTHNEAATENNVPNKIVPPQFGRRVKPSVSLSMLKEQILKADVQADDNSDNSVQPIKELIQEYGPTNDSLKSETVKQQIISETIPDVVNDRITSDFNRETDKVPVENINDIKEENISQPQCHETVIIDLITNSAESIINQKQCTPVNSLNSYIRNTQDITNKQKNDVFQSNRNLMDNSNNLVPLNNSQFQFSVTGSKKTTTSFKPKKAKFNDFARKVADARREFQRKYEKIPPDRSSLRMIDLIFYNPSTNPMESKTKLEKRDVHPVEIELINEGRADDPEPLDSDGNTDDIKGEEFGKMPVPQVKIGLNGEIILDEKSLVIETTDAKRGREDLKNSVPIFEDRGSKTCYYKRKTQKSRDWSDLETKRFYKALNTIGTDFSLMQKYFPVRTRLELKNKFKREEKLNRSLVDKALNNPSEFDITQFEKYLAVEKQVQEEEVEKRFQRKVRVKKLENRIRTKSSLLSREVTESDEDNPDMQSGTDGDRVSVVSAEFGDKNNETTTLCEKYTGSGVEHGYTGASGESDRSKVFTEISLNDVNNPNKIRDAFNEIRNFENSDVSRTVPDNLECGNSGVNVDVVDEFYQAVVSLSTSLKTDGCKGKNGAEECKRMKQSKSNATRGEKRKGPVLVGRKKGRKVRDCPFINTLDLETYDPKCETETSSDESNDNSLTSTKTITDQDFLKLLAANAQNMKESKIQFQITEDCSLGKNVEIILDSVPSITLSDV